MVRLRLLLLDEVKDELLFRFILSFFPSLPFFPAFLPPRRAAAALYLQ